MNPAICLLLLELGAAAIDNILKSAQDREQGTDNAAACPQEEKNKKE